jgi:hypothetical protein
MIKKKAERLYALAAEDIRGNAVACGVPDNRNLGGGQI